MAHYYLNKMPKIIIIERGLFLFMWIAKTWNNMGYNFTDKNVSDKNVSKELAMFVGRQKEIKSYLNNMIML